MKSTSQNKPATWQSVADALGVTRQALATWRKLEGAPSEPDAEAWRTFAADNDLGKRDAGSLTALKAELLRQQIEKARRENDVAAGKLIPIAELCAYVAAKSATYAHAARFTLEQEVPPLLMGKGIAEIRLIMRDACDRLTERYNSDFRAEGLAKGAQAGE